MIRSAKPLPPLQWCNLEKGLAAGKKKNVPIAVVFTTAAFNGPGTFHSHLLRDSLKKSKAVPVRVLPPAAPKSGKGMTPEKYRSALEEYKRKLAAYRAVAQEYGARTNPTVVFLAPDGGKLGLLYGPDVSTLNRWLTNLSTAVKAYRKRKAQEAEKAAREGAKKAGKDTPVLVPRTQGAA